MELVKLSLRYLVATMAAMVLIATSARADIVPFANYLLPSPGNPTADLAFVQIVTGDTLDLFQTNDADGTEQLFTTESVSVVETLATLWHLEWTTVNWDIRYVLVKGATPGTDGDGNGGGGNDGEGSDGDGDAGPEYHGYQIQVLQEPPDTHIYSLWEVTAAQFKNGSGDVYLLEFPAKEIAQITIFGQENPASVPEPTTLLLLGVGLPGIMALRRRPS